MHVSTAVTINVCKGIYITSQLATCYGLNIIPSGPLNELSSLELVDSISSHFIDWFRLATRSVLDWKKMETIVNCIRFYNIILTHDDSACTSADSPLKLGLSMFVVDWGRQLEVLLLWCSFRGEIASEFKPIYKGIHTHLQSCRQSIL